ncbi:uncharacterized protein RCC_04069 [Ramularia collo-cygni]|uniref:Uncharacterized protein n=1 Tax=Ramularia collo-cygni TaxID=112498 RepID=A0A2D3UVK9_9PEZI|nr:uncharacterized protein RCC_04069 [Ramularia collo-cygni]CZT18225.1 uncharacterized protein RCC_04069 [Ramularia collo-cygni]
MQVSLLGTSRREDSVRNVQITKDQTSSPFSPAFTTATPSFIRITRAGVFLMHSTPQLGGICKTSEVVLTSDDTLPSRLHNDIDVRHIHRTPTAPTAPPLPPPLKCSAIGTYFL